MSHMDDIYQALVEERPELRRAERNLTAIQADAHAALEQK